MKLKTNLKGMNELWLKNRHIPISDEEYEEIRLSCLPDVYDEELDVVSGWTARKVVDRMEKEIDLVKERAVDIIIQNNISEDDAEDELYGRLDEYFARHLRRQNPPIAIEVLQKLLGHKSVSTTMNIYASADLDFMEEELKRCAQKQGDVENG